MEVIKNDKLNKYNGIFICTVLKQNQFRYSYGRKAKNNAVSETIIKLPADKDGNPDWEFMENYIKMLNIKENNALYKMLLERNLKI